MKITKLGHSCILVEENKVRLLFDPGKFSTLQNKVKNLDAILISHGHGDHCDIDSIKTILQNNPAVKIITNSEVGVILKKEGIEFELLENNQGTKVKDVLIDGCGESHIIVYEGKPVMKNVGFIINNKLFFTGDSLTKLDKKIKALASPMAGPVLPLSQILDYVREINPEIFFPMHDAILSENAKGYYDYAKDILEPLGINFNILEIGKEFEF